MVPVPNDDVICISARIMATLVRIVGKVFAAFSLDLVDVQHADEPVGQAAAREVP